MRGKGRLGAEKGAVGILADADVLAKHSGTIQIRGAVKIAIVFGHDGGKRRRVLRLKIPIGVVAKEGIAPGEFRSPSFARGDDDIDAVKRVDDGSGDRDFVRS
jgi:hypothetical protein